MAGIGQAETDQATLTSEAQADLASLRHSMETIHHEINEHLDQLVPVGTDRRQWRFNPLVDRDAATGNPFLKHLQALVQDLTEIDGPPLRRLPSGEGKELVHHLGDSLDLRDD